MEKKEKQASDKSNTEIIEQLNKANYLYSFLSQVNKNIVRINDEQTLFKNSCSIAMEFGKFKMAWIGLFDHNKETITMVEHFCFPDEYIENLKNAVYYANGPQYHVLKTGTYYVCNDILNKPELKNWLPFSIKYGIGSCLVLPIRKNGLIIGTFNLYAGEKNFSGTEALILLEEVAENISFALDRLEKVKKYKESERIIQNNEKRFRALIENSTEMITLSTKEGNVFYASPAITKLFGYSVSDTPFIFRKKFIHPDDVTEFKKKRKHILKQQGASFFMTVRLRHKDGSWVWCEVTMKNCLEDEGVNALVTHSKNVTEEMIIKSEQEFDNRNFMTLINNTNDLMWSLDKEFNLLTSNKPFDDAIQSAGKFIKRGESVFNASLSPEQEQRFLSYYQRAFNGETFMAFEQNHDPVEFCIEISFSPILKDDKIVGVACHSRDVTDRKRAEEQIVKTNRLYQFLSSFNKSIVHLSNENALLDKLCSIAIETGGFALAYIGLIDGNGNLNVNNFHGDTNRAKKNQTQTRFDFNDPKYQHTPTAHVMRSGKLSFNNDMQNDQHLVQLKAEMMLRDIHSSISLPLFRFGKVIGVFGLHSSIKNFFDTEEINLLEEAVRDISFALENFEKERRHRETEELVLKNEKRFRALIENSTDMITLTNAEGNFIYASPSITKIFGYEQEEFIRISAFEFFHPDDVIELLKQRSVILDCPGKSFDFQYRILHKNGHWIWCEGTITNMLHELAIKAMVANFREVTEKMKAENEKEKMIADIVQRSKNLEQFAYIVSHNLRAPVCSIKGLANVMEVGLSEIEKNKARNYLFQSVDQLDEITKDLNKILRAGSESIELKEYVCFAELVNTIKLSINHVIEKEGITIETDFTGADSTVIVKSYIQSIFYNLISNSIKYRAPIRPLNIKIRSDQNHGKVKLFFRDNGSGIDLKRHGENIFGLYKRFHPETEGKGLGLFMVKTQIESIGGSITVNSTPGLGTEFIVELPS